MAELRVQVELLGEAAMLQFGVRLAEAIEKNLADDAEPANSKQALLIALQGDLGAGKTTLSRGILNALGHVGSVKSPTYTLVEPYDLSLGQVCHFDFYRLADPEELEYMGFQDYLADSRLCLIEWPQRGAGFLPEADILIDIVQCKNGRQVTLSGSSAVAIKILGQLDNRAQATGEGAN